MTRYLVIDADWLSREIRNAEVLVRHAEETGKPVAIAASRVRLEGLREIRRLAAEGLPPGEGAIGLSIAAEPRSPFPEEE